MDEAARITRLLGQRLFIELEASARHVHLTAQAAQTLFGHGLTPHRPLSQPGQFVCQERVTLVGKKGELHRVAVLGPERPDCQVELSMTDCVALGVEPCVRLSGDIAGTPGLVLRTDRAELSLSTGVIVAKRHIHMTPEAAAARGVKNGQSVSLRTFTRRPVTFQDVEIRVSDKFATYAHLDFDEANACGFVRGDLAMIVP